MVWAFFFSFLFKRQAGLAGVDGDVWSICRDV